MVNYTPIPVKDNKGWYEIPGFSRYAANEKGQILGKKTKLITYGGNAGKYLKVGIYKDGYEKHSTYYVHDLVCRAFYGEPPFKNAVVLHLDNNPRNNTKNNLRWGTQSQNIQQVWDDGLRKRKVNLECMSMFW